MNHLLNYHYHLRFTQTAKIKLIWDDDQCWLRRVPVCNGDKPEEKRFYFCCGEKKKAVERMWCPGFCFWQNVNVKWIPFPIQEKEDRRRLWSFQYSLATKSAMPANVLTSTAQNRPNLCARHMQNMCLSSSSWLPEVTWLTGILRVYNMGSGASADIRSFSIQCNLCSLKTTGKSVHRLLNAFS